MPIICSHRASWFGSSSASIATPCGLEAFPRISTNLGQTRLDSNAPQYSVRKLSWCSRMRGQQLTSKSLGALNSELQRCESQVSASSLNVYNFDQGEGGQGGKDDREEVKLKIPVGPTGNCLEQTFTFKRLLGPSSVFVVVTLRKPLGIIFEAVESRNKERVVVAELVQGSHAQRAARVNQMFQGADSNRKSCGGGVILNGDVRPGDILRATTTVGVVVDLFGIRAPVRVMMLHKADGRCWDDTMAALKASFVADGPLTLVLERDV
ncbi:hypothetical protein MPTK1_5g12910 [Marchantia polymorpha subsp. ruderalis]|nr:hypothetical protein MARPO_0092s0017 [Marchantia polymorpha]BBN11556.1 hypothetical protein Mp_5g12910 [Marchantia polymorpha subsp. ruderalis]|eukprot:PTQ33045.1 hypothetical protein MARPO_0092s0017 [Marchantia polymorpha]